MSDLQAEFARRDANASKVNSLVHHPLISLTVKSAVAAGAAWEVGSLLPKPVNQYAYYAALGALTVMVPVITDSVKEALRAIGAIAVGVTLAVFMQWVAFPDALTVGIVVGLGTVASGLRWFGDQRSWAPLAALFVLTAGAGHTEVYVLGYLTQIPLGAAIGIAVNFALLPPLPLHDVEASVKRMRGLLVEQLCEIAELLDRDEPPEQSDWRDHLRDLEPARQEMHGMAERAERARRGNLRSGRWSSVQSDLTDFADALERCSWVVEDVSVVMLEFERREGAILGDELRRLTSIAFRAVADALDHPEEVAPGSARTARAGSSIDTLLDHLDSTEFGDRESRYLAGAVAVSARRCLRTFARRYGDGSSQ